MVVVADLPEDRGLAPVAGFAAFQPVRIVDHRLTGVRHVAASFSAIDVLDLLDRVAWLADPQPLAGDLVQIHEDLVAE